MSEIKNKFFEKGFLYPFKAMEPGVAKNINDEYLKFYKNIKSESFRIEHKTKSHLLFKWANMIVYNENILKVVKEILGNDIVAWNSLIFLKPPNSKKFVSYHQDQNYWKIKMDKGLTVQVALSESTLENGCLQILPESHKNNYLHHDKKDTNNLLARGQEVKLDNLEHKKLENIILKPGEFCIFHGNIVHGSEINNSDSHRFLFSIRYLTPDNKINENLYYNYATLVSGNDRYNFFKKEGNLLDVGELNSKKLHEKLITRQAKIYSKIYLKNLSFLSNLMNIRFVRDVVYKIRSLVS